MIEVHPYAEIFPPMEGTDFEALVASIKENGLRDAITLYEGAVIDGRNRQLACELADVEARYEQLPAGTDPLAFVIDRNLRRRQLDESQRAMVAAKIATCKQGHNANSGIPLLSQSQVADQFNVSVDSVKAAAKVRNKGTPELQQAVEAGKASVSAAAEVAELPPEEQRAAVAAGSKAVAAKAKEAKAKKKKKRKARYTGSDKPAQTDHERHLETLQMAWDGACETAREKFVVINKANILSLLGAA